MEKHVCNICNWVYDPEEGCDGVDAGTAFDDLPDDFVCPDCGAGKDDFSAAE